MKTRSTKQKGSAPLDATMAAPAFPTGPEVSNGHNPPPPIDELPPQGPDEGPASPQQPATPISNPIMAEAIGRVQAVLQGQGATSNPALLLGQAHLEIARLKESLQIAIDALSAITAQDGAKP